MRWRLLIEEFGPELIYLPGVNDAITDCLGILKYEDKNNKLDHCVLDDKDVNVYPLSYKLIKKYQQKDNKLLQKSKNEKRYSLCTFTTAGRTHTLIISKLFILC